MNFNLLRRIVVGVFAFSALLSAQTTPDSSLLAKWSFERTYPSFLLLDESIHGHHLMVTENSENGNYRFGPHGKYLNFGTGLHTVVRESACKFSTAPFTFATFFYYITGSQTQTIFQSSSVNNNVYSGYRIQITSSNMLTVQFGDSINATWNTVVSLNAVRPSVVNHIAITYDGSVLQSFVNGQIESSQNFSGVYTSGTGSAVLGATSINGVYSEYCTQNIDEIHVFSRVLNSHEIYALAFPPKPTVSGCWNTVQSGPGRDYTGKMELSQVNNTVSGTIIWNSEYGSAPVTGTISGNIVTLVATFTSPTQLTVTYTGSISADSVQITGGTSSDANGGVYTFSATRGECAPIPPPTSTMCWTTHQQIAGSTQYWNGFMNITVDANGTVTGGTIDWNVPSHGEVTGGTISGTSATITAWFEAFNLQVTYSGTLSPDGNFITSGQSNPGAYAFNAEKITCP